MITAKAVPTGAAFLHARREIRVTEEETAINDEAAEVEDEPMEGLDATPEDDDAHPAISGNEGFEE
jgi:hypothetical protein